jgi:hypothetical protein
MAAGVPSVLSDCAGNVDIPNSDLECLIAIDGDPAIASDIVVRLLRDEARRRALGRIGKRRVETHFTLRSMGRAYSNLYLDLYGSAPSRGFVRRIELPDGPFETVSAHEVYPTDHDLDLTGARRQR